MRGRGTKNREKGERERLEIVSCVITHLTVINHISI